VQVESSQLDISSFSYDFTKFSTIFHFLEKKKTNQNRDGPKLNRPALQARFRPTRDPTNQPKGEAGADRRAPPVIHNRAGEEVRPAHPSTLVADNGGRRQAVHVDGGEIGHRTAI
jgi:hypothetical protein